MINQDHNRTEQLQEVTNLLINLKESGVLDMDIYSLFTGLIIKLMESDSDTPKAKNYIFCCMKILEHLTSVKAIVDNSEFDKIMIDYYKQQN